MAIGILSALDGIQGEARPDDNSVVPPIDRLASLPQTLIMQMAQKGQIPKTMVAPVLAKKAENAQMGMQMQAAMQKAQAGAVPPSTVIEKVIAQNAAQEVAPMDRSNVGVASAPMRPDMYRRGMAGGGIVAFAPGGLYDQERFSPPASFSSSLAQQEGGMSRADALKIKEKYEANMTPERASKFVEYNDALRALNIPLDPNRYGEQDIDGGSGPLSIGIVGAGKARFDEDAPSGIGSIFSDEGQAELDAYRKSLEAPRPDRTSSTGIDLDAAYEEVFGKKQPLRTEDVKTDKVEEVVAPPEEVVAPPTIEEDAGLANISAAEGKIQTKAIVSKLKEDQKGNKNKPAEPKEFVGLSGDDVAMLGLQFGLELLGTDQQNFFTAIGNAGKPALKTALALQQEKKKQAFTKSEREAGQKFQLELQDKKQAGAEKVAELQANAPTKIQKVARDLAKMRRENGVPNFTDLFDASKIVGAGASVDAALAGLAAKGVDAGADSYTALIGPGGALYGLEKVRVGTAKAKDLEPSIQEMIKDTKQILAQQQNVSPDAISDAQAASIILNQRRKQEISQGLSAAGTDRSTITRMVEERFPSGNILDFSDLK